MTESTMEDNTKQANIFIVVPRKFEIIRKAKKELQK